MFKRTKVFNEQYGCLTHDALLVQKLKRLFFDDHQIEDIIGVIEETCNICWDAEAGCQCWNDE